MTGQLADGAAVLSGAIVSIGALVALTGAGHLLAAARSADADRAIRRVLRAGPAGWRLMIILTGLLECLAGAAVCAGLRPRLAGLALACLGAAFTLVLVWARRAGTRGGCGCIPWRRAGGEMVGRRAVARAACVLAAGVLEAVAGQPGAPPLQRAWFYGGAGGGCLLLALLGAGPSADVLGCRLRWRPARRGLAELAGHPVFEAMTVSLGPWGPEYGRRRKGCVEEYWLPLPARDPGAAVAAAVFEVRRAGVGRSAVHASIREAMPLGVRRHRWRGVPAAAEKAVTARSSGAS